MGGGGYTKETRGCRWAGVWDPLVVSTVVCQRPRKTASQPTQFLQGNMAVSQGSWLGRGVRMDPPFPRLTGLGKNDGFLIKYKKPCLFCFNPKKPISFWFKPNSPNPPLYDPPFMTPRLEGLRKYIFFLKVLCGRPYTTSPYVPPRGSRTPKGII